jgi:hypothetical protein
MDKMNLSTPGLAKQSLQAAGFKVHPFDRAKPRLLKWRKEARLSSG